MEGRIVVDTGSGDLPDGSADGAMNGPGTVTGMPGACPGATPCTPSTCQTLQPLDPVIADWTGSSTGGRFGVRSGDPAAVQSQPWVYPTSCPTEQTPYPLSKTSSGVLRMTGTVGTWSGFGLWMGCMVDLSAYGGISFSVWGDAGPSGALTLEVATSADSPPDACITNVGTCAGDASACSAPSVTVPVPVEQGAPVTFRWSDFIGGSPVAGVDPAQVLSLSWSFGWVDWGGTVSAPYPIDVSLGQVQLVP
jgi:hypothetical protein